MRKTEEDGMQKKTLFFFLNVLEIFQLFKNNFVPLQQKNYLY